MRAASVELEVALGPRERREVELDSKLFSALTVARPKLWWPRGRGAQPIYRIKLAVKVAGEISDLRQVEHGIREVSSDLTDDEHALFRVNRQPILIRGGGWARDMLLRSNAERELYEYEYVKDLGPERHPLRRHARIRANFSSVAIATACWSSAASAAATHWEKWDNWKAEDHEVAAESLRSELRRLRNHPSLLAWWYGSDFLAAAPRRRTLPLAVLAEERWPNAAHSSAAAKPTELSGPRRHEDGGTVRLRAALLLAGRPRGAAGAFGFATEVGPGPAIPPVETLRSMLGRRAPVAAGRLLDAALRRRFRSKLAICSTGRSAPATGAPRRSRRLRLEGAAGLATKPSAPCSKPLRGRKYRATGVIQWMLNNAWPSLIWHLWDHTLRTGGGYFVPKRPASRCTFSTTTEKTRSAS